MASKLVWLEIYIWRIIYLEGILGGIRACILKTFLISKLRKFSTLRSFPRKSFQSWVEKLRISNLYSHLRVENFRTSTLSLFIVSKEILSNLRFVSNCYSETVWSWEFAQILLKNSLIFEIGFGVSQLWENVYNDYFLLISFIFWLL